MPYDLKKTHRRLAEIDFQESQLLIYPDEFVNPGFWVLSTALGLTRGYTIQQIQFANPTQQNYASAIGLSLCLTGEDDYPYARKNSGLNYSPLVCLDSAEATDHANTCICDCVRSFFNDAQGSGLGDLCGVIGELHDNVWAHGKSTGISMAQKWRIARTEDSHHLEFALADQGIGFKQELERSGQNKSSHLEAIEWCLQEGNSTKHGGNVDEWAQHVPPGHTGKNPYGPSIETIESHNFHQGLGLYKLTELTKNYAGLLRISSGDCIYSILEDGSINVVERNPNWQGVAISCRFDSSKLLETLSPEAETATANLAELLKRRGTT